MSTKSSITLIGLLLFALIFEQCTGQKDLQKGNYEHAISRSIAKLRKSPENEKAANTLKEAYNLHVKLKMEEVARLKISTELFRWESIIGTYNNLNYICDQINRCPACLKIIPDPNRYSKDLEEARYNAANVRYELGLEQMKLNSITSSQSAYRHFLSAKNFVNQFKDVDQQLKMAKDGATLKVIMEHIPMHSRSLTLSNEFFENKIHEFLFNLNYEFVRFYTPEEAQTYNIKAHQYIQCRFDDFVVGQVSLHEKEQEMLRDSVILKTETLPTKEVKNTYGTVKATVHVFTKALSSSGLIDLRILDANTGSPLINNKLPGTYVWETRWGWYNGDERALSKDQLGYIKLKEAYPPTPQQLFIEFTKPIYSQITGTLQNFYSKYRL